ncbi:MAG: hypothetical protein HY678_02075 [Chloroflexi bacterium]|nr:hypothetical protein [Chloroflexota bacterium]
MRTASSVKKPLAFRVRPVTLDHLRRRAEEVGESQTALAERYVEEGLRMDEHPLIYFRGGAMGRRASLLGTRLDVAAVVDVFHMNEKSLEKTAEYLELPVEQVEACLRYYADYSHEIDGWISRSRAVAEREENLWRKQKNLLG